MEPLKPHEVYLGQVIDTDERANYLDVAIFKDEGYCVAICDNVKDFAVGDIVYCRADADGNFFDKLQRVSEKVRDLFADQAPIKPPP